MALRKSAIGKLNLLLIVDGDKARVNNFSSRLRLSGYDTEVSFSGFQTLHLIEQAEKANKLYRMLIISGDTEDMPASEILSLSRNILPGDKLPILFMSSDSTPDEIYEMIDQGASDHVGLTDSFQYILSKIQSLAPIKKPGAKK